MIDRESILQLIQKNKLCVLSTAGKSGKSESAVMAVTVKADWTIFMNTEATSRKFKNILENNQVSVVVGGLDGGPSVQLDGLATVLAGEAAKAAADYMISVQSELKDYGLESGKFIAVKPFWCRYSDFSQNPPEIYETQL